MVLFLYFNLIEYLSLFAISTKRKFQFYTGVIIVLLSFQIQAKEITGKVIKVVDGDTIHLLPTNSKKYQRVRLKSIDCPEKKQPFGKKAKRYLSELIANEIVTVSYNKKDRYGRIIGLIKHNNLDINLAMVRAGYAWHYKKYQYEQSASQRKIYSGTEISSRANMIGLWSDSNAIAPWIWRKAKRDKHNKKE